MTQHVSMCIVMQAIKSMIIPYNSRGGNILDSNSNLVLTETDKNILESYKTVIDGLSDFLGSGYEFVLHSLENYNQSVIKIVNGHYTGRKEGAPITNMALNTLGKIKTHNHNEYFTYFNKNKEGKKLKSATIAIKGENKRIIGLLCANYYMDIPFSTVISEFSPTDSTEEAESVEYFSQNIDELLLNALEEAQKIILQDATIPLVNKNKEIIMILNEKGIFNLKDSVIKVSEILNISKNTVYLHLRNLSA